MKSGKWCITTDRKKWNTSPTYDTREEAVARAPEALGLKPGRRYWVGMAHRADSALCAQMVVDALDAHSRRAAPEGSDGYDLTPESVEELDVLLGYWAHKHEVRPSWFGVDDVKPYIAPKAKPAHPR